MNSPSPRSVRRARYGASGRRRGIGGWLARMAGNAVYVLLALAALGVLASIATCAANVTPGAGGGSGTATPASGDAWIPLRSGASADILAAARSGSLYQESRASGADARDLSRLGTPVFVQALRPAGETADQMPDFYVVPALSPGGAATDAIELALNSTHTAVQEIAIITYSTPRDGDFVAQIQKDQAVQLVTSQRHVALQPSGAPKLVYFALDAQSQSSQTGQPLWSGGGALPADPIWLVPTADGSAYLAGNDGMVYTVGQLPQSKP